MSLLNNKYSALRATSSIFRSLGGLQIGVGIILIILLIGGWEELDSRIIVLGAFVIIVLTFFSALFFYFFAQIIELFIDIEENTRNVNDSVQSLKNNLNNDAPAKKTDVPVEQTGTIFCTFCGQKYSSDANTCTICGNKLN